MLSDARYIANLYTEGVPASPAPTRPAAGSNVVTTTPDTGKEVTGTTTLPATPNPNTDAKIEAPAQANEEKKEKVLPSKHWVKVERVVKDNVKDIENLAHEITMLVHTCCENEEVTGKVMRKIFKKHRSWVK
jgi:hypothetical protein